MTAKRAWLSRKAWNSKSISSVHRLSRFFRKLFFAFFNSMLILTQSTLKNVPVSLHILRLFHLHVYRAEKREQKDMFHAHLHCAVILHVVYLCWVSRWCQIWVLNQKAWQHSLKLYYLDTVLHRANSIWQLSKQLCQQGHTITVNEGHVFFYPTCNCALCLHTFV